MLSPNSLLNPSTSSTGSASIPLSPSSCSSPVVVVSLTVHHAGRVLAHVDVCVLLSAPSPIPQAPVLHPFSPFFRGATALRLHRPLPSSSSAPICFPFTHMHVESEEKEEKKQRPHTDCRTSHSDDGRPLPLHSFPRSFLPHDEEKAPHSPLSPPPRSRSSSCPEHVITFPVPNSVDTTLTRSPPSLSSLIHHNPPPLCYTIDPDADVWLNRRLYRQVVAQMLQHEQAEDGEWTAMEARRVALQERIDRHMRAAVGPAVRGVPRWGSPLQERAEAREVRDVRLSLWTDDLDCDASSTVTFACPVCLESLPSHCGVSLPCSHVVCGSCLSSYLSTHIAEGQIIIRCPCFTTRPCPAVLSNALIAAFTPAVQYSHWLRLCRQKKNSAYRACPRCDHQQKGNRLRPSMRCHKCHFQYCYKHANAHPPAVSCRAYSKTQRESVRASLKCIAQTTVQCPSCGVAVELSSGCNHMTCSQCECEFCFLCGGRYLSGLHFWEFNYLTGCPGMQHVAGLAGDRRTLRLQLFRLLIGYPLTLLLVPLLFCLALATFVAVEALWLVAFVALLPWVLLVHCCCSGWVDRWQWRTTEKVNFWLFLGPRLFQRICSCC